jgi:prepilin-type N-terminal cleavage/methylation domain-containing protein
MQAFNFITTNRHAFSLVELSIVLVILGLLTGGILTGQSLIRASELRSISASAQRFTAAHYTFRDKYFALPGDMANATVFWGVLAGTGSDDTCQNTEATGVPTCNGNGDGLITTTSGAGTTNERFRYWQHLANAGLVEGSYTGRTDSANPATYAMTPGKNAPSINGGNVQVDPFTQAATVYSATAFPFPNMYRGGEQTLAYRTRGNPGANLLLPEEAWNLDTKLDDGLPARGKFLSSQMSWSASPNCTTSDDPATATYSLTNSNKICRFNLTIN